VSILSSRAFAEEAAEVQRLLQSARAQIGRTIKYDGSYQRISYPGGDVPIERGVCSDVVIRAYRSIGIDLQKQLHEDLKLHFSAYPSKRIWGLSSPDSNIDHRRVPNLEKFLERHGHVRSTNLGTSPAKAGDLLTWRLPGGLPHIGIVSDRQNADGKHNLVIHNIGRGAKEEDVIGQFELSGHYRYAPWE